MIRSHGWSTYPPALRISDTICLMVARIRRIPWLSFAAIVSASLGAGCGDDSTSKDPPSRTDASADATLSDGGLDGTGGDDAASDALADVATEDVLDAAPDVSGDASLDGSGDSEAGTDAELDAAPDGSTGPMALCLGPGGGGHVKLVSAYWAGTTALGDHLSELVPAMQAGHVDVARLEQPLPAGLDVIVDLHWELFDYTTHTVRADMATRLDAIAATAEPVLGRIRAFYPDRRALHRRALDSAQ